MHAPHPTAEAAVTLAETIVGAVVGVLVLTLVVTMLINGRRSADDAIATEQAARQTMVLVSTLASDVRAARAPGRDDVDDPIELASLLATPGLTSVSDILRAGPDELQLRTRARTESTSPCVWWRRDAAGTITRSIHADASCAGAAARTEQLGVVPRTPTGHQRGVPALFTYGVLRDDDPSTGDPAKCHVERTTTPGPLGAIVEVGASFDLTTRKAERTRRQASLELTGVRSRDEAQYRAALGCAW